MEPEPEVRKFVLMHYNALRWWHIDNDIIRWIRMDKLQEGAEEDVEGENKDEELPDPLLADNEEKEEQEQGERPRKTSKYMTKYERARILGTRALQIRLSFLFILHFISFSLFFLFWNKYVCVVGSSSIDLQTHLSINSFWTAWMLL